MSATIATRAGAPVTPPRVTPSASRLQSLDAFRGITIAGMLLVNNPGSWSTIYDPLEHAPWHGWTPTDLIFPFFLFIVGVSMTLSYAKQQERGATRNDLLRKAALRSLLIFVAGLALHSFPWIGYDFSQIRIPGVLQRIAVAYLVASIIYLYVPTIKGRVLAVTLLLYGYWFLQTLVPVPGGLTGVLQPGLDLGAYIDRAVFTTAHLWKSAKTWDPEGLLSTMPAVGTVLLGAFAGGWLQSARTRTEITLGLFIAGLAGMMLGAMWGWSFPINKNLWTSSYVIFTAGIACQVFALCYWLIDVQDYRAWARPFVVFGTNALTAFWLSGAFARVLGMIQVGPDSVSLKTYLYRTYFLSWATPLNASLFFAVAFVLLWLGIMWLFYRNRIFIKL